MKIYPKAIVIVLVLALLGLWGTLYLISYVKSRENVYLPGPVESFLLNADQFTLFSINPDSDFSINSDDNYLHAPTNTFQSHAILGQLDVKSDATRMELLAALNRGIGARHRLRFPGFDRGAPSCFNPRHAIRAKKGDETVELLICFECQHIEVTVNKTNSWYLTSNEPAGVFNGILKQAGVPLPTN